MRVRQRDKGVCQICGERAIRPEYDHIVPFSEGGLTVLENMRTLCGNCHKERTKIWHRDRKHGATPPLIPRALDSISNREA